MKKYFLVFSILTLIALGAAEIHLDPRLLGRGASSAWVTADNVIPEFSPGFVVRFNPSEVEISVMVPRMEMVAERVTGNGNDDPQIFAGETIEIMLSPEPQSGVYYHIGINPAGFCYTAKKRDKSWGKSVTWQVSRRHLGWSATVRIPYSALETTFPEKGKLWRFNVGATMAQRDGKMLSVNWNGATNYHDIAEFGTIFFDDQDLTTLPYWRVNSGEVKAIAHLSPQENQLFCRVGEKVFPAKVHGSVAVFEFDLPDGVASLRNRLKCRFERADGSFVAEAYASTREAYRFTLDGFYYTPSMKVSFCHDAPAATIRLLRDGKVVRECAAPQTGSFPLAALPEGDYVVELVSGNWRNAQLIKVFPENFAPVPIADTAQLSISDALLKLDNIPVFLLSCSDFPKFPLPDYAAFNLGGARAGMQRNAVHFMPQPGIRRMITYPDADHIIETLLPEIGKSYREHPDHRRSFARLSYEAQLPLHIKTSDGKKFDVASQPYFAKLYTELKREYPDRLYSIHIDNLNLIPAFAPYCDILELTSWRASFAVNMMRFLSQDMRAAKSAVGKPVIFWIGGALPSPDQRSAELLRAAIYEAMLARLSGVVIHTGHGGIPASYARTWSLLAGINAEIQGIYPDLAQGIDLPDFVARFTGDCRCVARKNGGVTHLVVFNLSENETVFTAQTAKGELGAVLTPLEVKVYTWRE